MSNEASPDHCMWGEHGPVPCSAHAAEAEESARAAGIEACLEADRNGLSNREMAQRNIGASAYAWQAALERPLTPCTDGSPGLGWPSYDEDE